MPGEYISWALDGPRTCTGVWTRTGRRPCPAGTALTDGTDPQCALCARADKGRQIARDAAPDDGREYLLYLALFGPGLVKVGLTAADRGRDRLLEQGAITFAVVAAGPYTPIRQAERYISAAGLAAERISARAKAAAWRVLAPPRERAELLAAARDKTIGAVPWADQVQLRPGGIVDQARDFGLDGPVRDRWHEVTGISGGAILSGRVSAMIGHRLLLATPAGPLLCDMRRVAGWSVRPLTPASTEPPEPAGLTLTAGPAPGGPDDHSQQALF